MRKRRMEPMQVGKVQPSVGRLLPKPSAGPISQLHYCPLTEPLLIPGRLGHLLCLLFGIDLGCSGCPAAPVFVV
jgi:hypothetical protein